MAAAGGRTRRQQSGQLARPAPRAGPRPRPRILLAGHMDAVGMMVTGMVDGFLHITEVGGLDPYPAGTTRHRAWPP